MADFIQISPVFHERPFAVPGANPDSMLSPVQFSCDTSPCVLELCLYVLALRDVPGWPCTTPAAPLEPAVLPEAQVSFNGNGI